MAQSALSVFSMSPVAASTIGLRSENLFYGDAKANLLLRRYSETATRTRTGIVGAISGCTLQAAYSDPVLTIDLGGWVITRGGFANAGPGALIDSSIIANWRNGAARARTDAERKNGTWPEGTADSFGWDVMRPGNQFIVQDPVFTRVPGSLSEVSLKLVLECTGNGGGGAGLPPVVDNGGDIPPEVGVTLRIVTVYTDQGSYQVLTSKPNPTLDDFFGSATGAWETGPPAKRPISGMPVSNPGADVQLPPINVLGVNVQADSGAGSGAGGEWLAGSSAEVTAGGFVPVEYGTSLWFFVLPNDGNLGRENIFMVSGHDFQPDALASIGKTEAEFVSIYYEVPSTTGGRTNGWTKGKIDGVNLGSFFTRPGEA